MERIALCLFVCVALCGLISAAERKIAYEHDEKIFVANVDGTHAKKIADGALPEISPDGTRIAFNTEGDACAVWRNFRQRPGRDFLGVTAVRIRDENVIAVFVRDLALRRIAERGKRDAKEHEEGERFHWCNFTAR